MSNLIFDISEHNGKVDFEALKKHASGIIIRIGYGNDEPGQDDAYIKRNISECDRLGIPYGFYLYSYATNHTMIVSEVNHIRRILKECGANPTLPIYLDMEEPTIQATASKVAIEYLAQMKEYKAGIYSSASWWNTTFKGNNIIDNGYKWVAQYYSKCEIDNPYMWQYTDKYEINGKYFDASILYGKMSKVEAKEPSEHKGHANSLNEVFNSFFDTYLKLAQEVIDGKWGNGESRKFKLHDCGYDPRIVQELVNATLQ